ncbi:MAG: signal peptidase I [Chloroflexi bacterium RBG_16_50_9]|nr:MAG: signal peptidase I [Chloroflexi bacterium RBG_16_50_9]
MKKDTFTARGLVGRNQIILEEMWQEACRTGNSLSFRIASGSMRPLIESGNVVAVSRIDPSRVRIGDIVAVQDGRNVIVHRVIGKSRAGQHLSFRHMGDAGRSSKEVQAENLIGLVTVIKKEGGEIHLDSPRQVTGNRVLAWRLRLVDTLNRRHYRPVGRYLRMLLRPIWRLCLNFLPSH